MSKYIITWKSKKYSKSQHFNINVNTHHVDTVVYEHNNAPQFHITGNNFNSCDLINHFKKSKQQHGLLYFLIGEIIRGFSTVYTINLPEKIWWGGAEIKTPTLNLYNKYVLCVNIPSNSIHIIGKYHTLNIEKYTPLKYDDTLHINKFYSDSDINNNTMSKI